MDQVVDLVLAPFRDMVEKGNIAISNAGENKAMVKSGESIVKEGERAVKRIEPQCQRHYNEFGSNFLDALKGNDEIADFRRELTELLWEFDDYIELDNFDPVKYSELQQASRKTAPRIHDILVRMRLSPPVTIAMSTYSASSGDGISAVTPRSDSLTADHLDFNFPTCDAQSVRSQLLAMHHNRQNSPAPSVTKDFESLGIHHPRPQIGNILAYSPSTMPLPQLSPPPSTPLPPRPPSANPWDPQIKPGTRRSSGPSPQLLNDIPSAPVPPRSFTIDTSFTLPMPSSHNKPLSPSRTLSTANSQREGHSPASEMRNPFSQYEYRQSGTDLRGSSSDLQSLRGSIRPESSCSNPHPRARILATSSGMYAPASEESPILGVVVPTQTTTAPTAPRIRVPPLTIPEHAAFSPDSSITSLLHRNSNASFTRLGRQRSLESMQSNSNSQSDYRGSTFSVADSHTSTIGTSVASSPNGGSYGSQMPQQFKDIPNSVPEESISPRSALHSDDGLIVVSVEAADNNKGSTIRQSADLIRTSIPALKPALIGPASSFNIYKGFCKGAYEVINGDIGVTPVRKQTFTGSHTVGRCTHCMFELDYKELEYDINNDDRGNFTLAGIGFRIRMLQKSHVATRRNDEQFYACMICVNLGQTVEESDATVFFTQKDLFHHLSRHPRPLPPVEGLTIVQTPEIPSEIKNNYDLHIKGPQTISLTSTRAEEIANMPSAICKETIKKLYGMRMLSDHTPTFEMAEGARVVGIEFPEKYEGEWCMGFHDGAYASFPFDVVRLEQPMADVLRRNSSTTVRAVARWRFAPKYKKEHKGDWLKFEKGEVITNIGWISKNHWCWSGTNSKGKWGVFLTSHIDMNTVVEGGKGEDEVSLASSGKTTRTEGGTFLSKFKKGKDKFPPLPRA